jgi:ATP-dependent Clp protease ATP-binding subunit ClpC
MFENFTDPARNVVATAQEEAKLLGHSHIGTEHLLLGALGAGGEAEPAGIDVAEARRITRTLVPANPPATATHFRFTVRARRVLVEGALHESAGTGHTDITQWHLLLSVIADPENTAVQVLTTMGADIGRLREQVAELQQHLAEAS